MSTSQGDIMMVGNVKNLVNRLSKDFSASKPLSFQEPRRISNLKPSQPLQQVITTFAYTAAQEDELTLELGDLIEVVSQAFKCIYSNICIIFYAKGVRRSRRWLEPRASTTHQYYWHVSYKLREKSCVVLVPPSNIAREEEKVVIRPTANPDQPEANRRTPSVVGGMNIIAGKTQVETRDEPKTKGWFSKLTISCNNNIRLVVSCSFCYLEISIVEMARVKFEYEPQHSDELRLGEIGQLITIIRKDCGDAGWFEGEINGRRGLFPDNFVELVQVPVNTQSGVIYHPSPQHIKLVAKPPMVTPMGINPPAVPAKPLKQKFSETSTCINGSITLPLSSSGTNSSASQISAQIKHQSSSFAAARDRISKDLIVGQPGQMSSKLTKSVIVSSGSDSNTSARPVSNIEIEGFEETTSPLSHVTKTRARPPGKRPASLLLVKKKESTDNFPVTPSKSISNDVVEKHPFISVAPILPSPSSTHSTIREEVSSSITPAMKVMPLQSLPVEVKTEDKNDYNVVKPLETTLTHPGTPSLSSDADGQWVSRNEYNELLIRLASIEARIDQLERR
ncbi:SH3 domain protein [Dictyocaulus viviparus]|uniref:SH3 domain protein n=1 Tax=Dictyocaulus viviparus TaxID=29172 RepID=A0A0D8Y7V0_DICVI|nr:SH3 domain protein [Dictyocaulus viviparus]